MQQLRGLADRAGAERGRRTRRAGFTAVQQRYTYLQPRPGAEFGVNPHASEELLDYVRSRPELTMLGYTTQLSGAYTDAAKEIPEQYRHAGSDARLAALAEAASELGATKNQVVLSWLSGGAPAVPPIVGAARWRSWRSRSARSGSNSGTRCARSL